MDLSLGGGFVIGRSHVSGEVFVEGGSGKGREVRGAEWGRSEKDEGNGKSNNQVIQSLQMHPALPPPIGGNRGTIAVG